MADDREDGLCAITRPCAGTDGKFPKCIFSFGHIGHHSWANHPDVVKIESVCNIPQPWYADADGNMIYYK